MIFRLEYKNKALKTARVDIITPTGTGVETVEGTGYPFMLKYEGDKKNKGLMFLSSSAEINIYETPLFNIDTLKTSGEKDIRVNYYIDSVLEWTGFVIPDFFSREIGGDGVVSMVASDRLSVLDSEVLEGLPVTVTLRTLLSSCLAKTGLTLPLKTVVDFALSGTTLRVLDYHIRSQRLTDTKGRSVNCKDVIKSILVATNSKIMQRKGEWWVINKMQHELGGGRVYTSPTAFTNYVEDLISFTDVTRGAMRTIAPVAGGVGVFQEYGGGKLIPDNYNFKNGLTGWTNYNGFVSSTNNRRVLGYTKSGNVYTPIYDDAGTSEPYLVNRNISPLWVLYSTPMLSLFDPYEIRSTRIISPVVSGDSSSAKAAVEINAVGRNGTHLPFSIVLKRPGRKNLFLSRNNEWQSRAVAQLLSFKNEGADNLAAVSAGMSVSAVISAESSGEALDDVGTYTIEVLIFGSGLQGDNTVDNTTLINSASVQFTATSNDTPKGTLYKADQGGESYTKIHDTETTVFGDYLTGGLNGYFYNYAPDDTSSLLAPNGSRSQPAWVNTYTQNTEPLPLLQQTIRQMRRMFSVAHDFIKGEIDVADFDPLSIFEDCERRFVIVEAEFDFLRGSLQVVLEEVAYQNLTVREYIYSYFGEGDEGIRGISGISAGSSGGGGGGGVAPEPSWLENEITIDPESGYLSVSDWHVKGNLIIEGQVNQWLAQQLVVDDARIQVNRKQGGATVDSGLVIYNKDTSSEVSSLVYDVNGIWRAGGQRIYTDAYKPLADNATNLGGYSAASYPRKAEAATITGAWEFSSNPMIRKANPAIEFADNVESIRARWLLFNQTMRLQVLDYATGSNIAAPIIMSTEAPSTSFNVISSGYVGFGIVPTERLHVAGNGLFTDNVTAGGNVGGAGTFVGGFAGSNWLLDKSENHLTVDRLTVRGRMDVYELVVNQIRATNGSLWVSDSAKVTSVTEDDTYYYLNFDDDNGANPQPFFPNDIIKAQKFTGRNVRVVYGRLSGYAPFFTSNSVRLLKSETTGIPQAGDEFVRIGNSANTDRQGALYLTSSDNNAPYMDVLDGVNTGSFAGKTKVRLGRLDGITDADLGTLSGYGLYAENAYLKGKVVANEGLIGGFTITDNLLVAGSWDPAFSAGSGVKMDAGGRSIMAQYDTPNNRVEMFYRSSTDWGLLGKKNNATVFKLGHENQIAGINFDDSRLFTQNWELNKDGSFYFGAGGTIDGGLIAGAIESANWDGTVGSRLNLLDGSLEFGNTIKVDSFSKEIIVKDGATQNTGVRIGDFLLSPTTGGAGALDVDLSGSRNMSPSAGYSLPNALTYITSSGVIWSVSENVSTNLSAGNSYTFQTGIKVRMVRHNMQTWVVDHSPDLTPKNSLSQGSVTPMITVSLFSGATKVGEQTFIISGEPDLGDVTFFDKNLNISIPFTAASNSLRVEISQSGELIWKAQRSDEGPIGGDFIDFMNVRLTYSELNTSSRVRIVPSAAINELSAKGFLSLWGSEKYFRIYDRVGVTNFIEARGVQQFISPNGTYRLRVSDSGIQKSTNGGQSWTTL